MPMRSWRGATWIVLAGTLALAACTFAPQPESPATPTNPAVEPSAIPSPTPESVDPLESVVQLVMRAEALELRSADGTIVTALAYGGPVEDAVAVLSTVFGGPPVDEAYRGTNHTPPGVFHAWDDVTLDERHYTDSDVTTPEFRIYFDAPTTRGIDLSTAQGYHADALWADLESHPDVMINDSGCTGPYVEYVMVPSESGGYKVGVVLRLDAEGTAVEWIAAPVPIWEDGCA